MPKPMKKKAQRRATRVQRGPSISPAEARYRRAIVALIEHLKDAVRELLPKLPAITASYQANQPRTDSTDDAVKLINMASIRVSNLYSADAVRKIALRSGRDISEVSKEKFNKQMESVLGVQPFVSEPWLADEMSAFTEENVSLIVSIRDEFLADVKEIILRGIKRGDLQTDIGKKLARRYDVSVRRGRMIARDQTNKLAGRMDKLRQTTVGIKQYAWETAGDEAVRPMHRALDGKVFDWDKPPITNPKGERNHPGEDINCRCWARPIVDDLFPSVDKKPKRR